MSKTAIDYPITWGYLEQGTIKGQTYTHRGLDRAMPIGIPIVIDGVTIGYSGNTGLSTGPHLHIQAGRDAATQNTINPAPYEFKGGVVTALRRVDEKSWGRYVTIRTDSGVYVTYAHLESVNVTIGQRIEKGEEEVAEIISRSLAQYLGAAYLGYDGLCGRASAFKEPAKSLLIKEYAGKELTQELIVSLWRSSQARKHRENLAKQCTGNGEFEMVKEDLYRKKG